MRARFRIDRYEKWQAALMAHYTSFDNADNRRYMLWFCRELLGLLDAVQKQLNNQFSTTHN